jgi:hypothetical protein
MENIEVVADTVDSWTQKEGADTVLRLSGGGQLMIRRTDPHYKVWTEATAFQKEKHWPIYLEFGADSRIVRQLLLCTPREVEEVRPQASGDMTVVFRRAPSFYSLKKAMPHFDATLALLKASAQRHTPLLVAVHPTTLEILYATPLNGQ